MPTFSLTLLSIVGELGKHEQLKLSCKPWPKLIALDKDLGYMIKIAYGGCMWQG